MRARRPSFENHVGKPLHEAHPIELEEGLGGGGGGGNTPNLGSGTYF